MGLEIANESRNCTKPAGTHLLIPKYGILDGHKNSAQGNLCSNEVKESGRTK